ncbi:MAG: secondary thiamine-phosphate synthase enzyme YjbQ [Candidatus Micrarchaeia archaeon]
MEKVSIATSKRVDALDITSKAEGLVEKKGWRDGVLFVFCPHTTCALACNEFEDYIKEDYENFFSELRKKTWRHNQVDGNADAHLKQVMFGSSVCLFVEKGSIQKGTWQHLILLEGDGPRTREVWIKFISSK